MSAEPTSVAQVVARFLRDKGSDTAFVVAGGASLHLIHAFATTPGCRYIPMHHEQSAAMAADGFSRSSGRLGVAIATSGPGATNLITGIAGCFYDSIPAIFVTGQVSTTRMTGSTGARQVGFQETPIVEMVRPITKAAIAVHDKSDIRAALEEAYWIAAAARPGPVLLDIPDDIQRQTVVWDDLAGFAVPSLDPLLPNNGIACLERAVHTARRPVLVGGAGIVLAGAESAFRDLAERWGVPVVLTWGAAHLLPDAHPCRVGLFGTHGSRAANVVVQNADLVVSVGSRLDTKATGSPVSSFAREAVKIVVDIDAGELRKFAHFGLDIDCLVHADATDFLQATGTIDLPEVPEYWLNYIHEVTDVCAAFDDSMRIGPGISPYEFMRALGVSAPSEVDVFVDTGCALPWLMTGYALRDGHRLIHDLNNTAMGWSIPAVIGGLASSPLRRAVCIVGDGSLMMTMHDLPSLAAAGSAARIVVIDNAGYSMIRQTQDQWFGSEYHSSSVEGGLRFPDYRLLAESCGFSYVDVSQPDDVAAALAEFWGSDRPVMLRLQIDPIWRVVPQVKFGRPNEDMEPLLPRDVFDELMLVPSLPQSESPNA